eukprot:441470-Karenia_brevis.AAC.1
MFHVAQLAGLSVAVLFIDVESAFASLARRLVFDISDGDEAYLAMLRAAGFNCDEVAECYQHVCQAAWHPDTNNLARSIAEEMHKFTWASIEGVDGVINTLRGTCAGAPLADITYIVAMSVVLKRLRVALAAAGCIQKFSCRHASAFGVSSELELPEVSYIDDVSLAIFAPASALLDKISVAVSIVLRVFASYGMHVNFKMGKTEVILHWVGAGSQKAARKVAIDNCGLIGIPSVGDGLISLRVVSAYKHLGSQTTASPYQSQE